MYFLSYFCIMKVLPFKIPKPENNTLIYQEDIEVIFYDKLHQHEEIQISFIDNGSGTLIVGDTIHNYKSGDIIIIGSNLPHVFKSDSEANTPSKMMSLFFTKASFGEVFFQLDELQELQSFFTKSLQGFTITSMHETCIALFHQLKKASRLNRFIFLLKILKITNTATSKPLSNFSYNKQYSNSEGERMRNVFEYTINNFGKDISLKEISNIANMTKNAFCKYFKKRTNKTYFQFLNELRIENACQILIKNPDSTIVEAAYRTGFNNISNFNRKFKELKRTTPSRYRTLH